METALELHIEKIPDKENHNPAHIAQQTKKQLQKKLKEANDVMRKGVKRKSSALKALNDAMEKVNKAHGLFLQIVDQGLSESQTLLG